MQKRMNNFYDKKDKNHENKNQNDEENNKGKDNDDKYNKFKFTEVKTYNKNKINSPYVSQKRNFLNNNDYRLSDKQYMYESANKMSKNSYSFQNNTINERNLRGINDKYYTEFNTENSDLYYNEIQSKIYKKVIEQIYNNLYKYCKKLLFNEYSKFLNNVKKIALISEPKPKTKTYRKKNIVNKTYIYKMKTTPDKFNQKRSSIENYASPLNNYKEIKAENPNNFNHKSSINSRSSKNNVIYSNYYNLNFFENNSNNRYIYSNKRNKTKVPNEFSYSHKNSIIQKNINLNSITDFGRNYKKDNNFLDDYSSRKRVITTSFGKNQNNQLNQQKNYKSIDKNYLTIDNKNSMVFINYSTKKKVIDKLQNIKLFKQTNNDENDKQLNSDKDNLEKKKENFQKLMKNLKCIAFYKHIEKFMELIYIKNKKEVLEKLKTNKTINKEKSENKEDNINDQKNNSIESIDNKENRENKDDNNNLKQEDISNKSEKGFNDEIKEEKVEDIKNIDINYENVIQKLDEENNLNNIENNDKDNEIIKEKKDNNIINNNKINDLIKEININEKNSDDNNNNIKENEFNLVNNNEDKRETIKTDIQTKEEEIDNAKDKSKLKKEELNTSINKQNNEGEEENNFHLNHSEEEEEKKENKVEKNNDENLICEEKKEDNINKINIALRKIFRIIELKKINDTIKESFTKWKQTIDKNNKSENNKENEIINLSNDIIEEKQLENKEEKRNLRNMKSLFFDEVDDDEKEVILEEMIFRFRTLLISSCFVDEENFSDSFE